MILTAWLLRLAGAYGRYLLIAVGCVRWYQKKLKDKNVSMLVQACMRVRMHMHVCSCAHC